MNIAIFSPNQNPYSETFIQAHKNNLAGKIFYYYGNGWGNITLEQGNKKFNQLSTAQKIAVKLTGSSVTHFQKQNLVNSLKQHKIDAALIEYGQHAHWLREVLAQAEIPYAVHFHGHDATEHRILKNTGNYSEVFKRADKIIAVSQFMKQHLLDLGCPQQKLLYNVYGPRPEFAEIKPTLTSQKFISVGRFTNKKAPYYTLLAFSKIAAEFPKSELVFAGDGQLFETCVNLTKQLNLEKQVRFMGVANADQLKEELSSALAYVQHSITAENGDMEGTPLSILEASSAGLPVVSTFHAGIPDVILDQKTGLLCQEHDVEAMAANMKRLLSEPGLAQELGANARKHIAENYTLKRHISTLDSVLADIAKS
ncbi:glycosyltransferase family 4 protein [Gilvibacter sediminis]|uniref:glycosyltransferase family 4 protein n=1 Tax=Gilvibacter sediminis TaxID=379071 RepID=UPI00234FBA31|nr:glycosyltransferase family 4 protein [Gilvibacter sediminis]MDC7999265.1 glycosyltransferase family 4 protein [Gilvibacter sediminis]